jgi:hypothetical protein
MGLDTIAAAARQIKKVGFTVDSDEDAVLTPAAERRAGSYQKCHRAEPFGKLRVG